MVLGSQIAEIAPQAKLAATSIIGKAQSTSINCAKTKFPKTDAILPSTDCKPNEVDLL